MPWWYFEKEELRNTPSIKDGLDYDTEKRYRREATNFIKECGNLMNLGYATMHTAIAYLHRFYMFHSFKTFPRFVTACSCLFLAGKVEETPKKCRDIIRKAVTILSSQKMASFGEDPKEEVITMERILLKTIKFDLQVDHPYRFLIEYAKCLKSGGATPKEQVVQKAWNFINDSLETTLCLQWEPEIIAVAMMYLACKISKYDVVDWKGRTPEHQKWWDMFVKDMSKNILDDICHQVLDLYQNPKNKTEVPESPPQQPLSKASPPMKRAKFQTLPPQQPQQQQQQQQQQTTQILQQSPAVLPSKVAPISNHHIPVKVSSNDHDISKVPPSNNNIHCAFQPSTSYSHPTQQYVAPPLPSYPSSMHHHNKPPPPNYLPNNMSQQPAQIAAMPLNQNIARYPTSGPPPPTNYYHQPVPPHSTHYPHKNRSSNHYQQPPQQPYHQ